MYIGATRRYQGDDAKQIYRIAELSSILEIPMVATNDVHYHQPARRELQDIITLIIEGRKEPEGGSRKL